MHNKTNETLKLYKALLSLKTEDECYAFLDDICSPKEIEQMAQRLHAAELLNNSETYESVISKTGISSTTLSRVSKCVKQGTGYKTVLKRIK